MAKLLSLLLLSVVLFLSLGSAQERSPKKGMVIPSWPRHFVGDFDNMDTIRWGTSKVSFSYQMQKQIPVGGTITFLSPRLQFITSGGAWSQTRFPSHRLPCQKGKRGEASNVFQITANHRQYPDHIDEFSYLVKQVQLCFPFPFVLCSCLYNFSFAGGSPLRNVDGKTQHESSDCLASCHYFSLDHSTMAMTIQSAIAL